MAFSLSLGTRIPVISLKQNGNRYNNDVSQANSIAKLSMPLLSLFFLRGQPKQQSKQQNTLRCQSYYGRYETPVAVDGVKLCRVAFRDECRELENSWELLVMKSIYQQYEDQGVPFWFPKHWKNRRLNAIIYWIAYRSQVCESLAKFAISEYSNRKRIKAKSSPLLEFVRVEGAYFLRYSYDTYVILEARDVVAGSGKNKYHVRIDVSENQIELKEFVPLELALDY